MQCMYSYLYTGIQISFTNEKRICNKYKHVTVIITACTIPRVNHTKINTFNYPEKIETIVETEKNRVTSPSCYMYLLAKIKSADKERKFSYNCSGSVFINTQIVYTIFVTFV